MFWMRAYPLLGQMGGGWALEFESFLGHVKWNRADRRVPFGAQKTRDLQTRGEMSGKNNVFLQTKIMCDSFWLIQMTLVTWAWPHWASWARERRPSPSVWAWRGRSARTWVGSGAGSRAPRRCAAPRPAGRSGARPPRCAARSSGWTRRRSPAAAAPNLNRDDGIEWTM